MIYTSNYLECKPVDNITVSISGDRGKGALYKGRCFPKLAPKLSFWQVWHDNIDKISEEENNKFYIEQYYIEVLSKLDSKKIYDELNGSILLCYEDSHEFCHRHIVAEWLEISLGIEVSEIKIKDGMIEKIERPAYIRRFLEEVMGLKKHVKTYKKF